MLTGSELLAKVKELGDVSKSDLVRACGYVSTKKDGTERLNFTAFYEALLGAKGVALAGGGSEPGKAGRKLAFKAVNRVEWFCFRDLALGQGLAYEDWIRLLAEQRLAGVVSELCRETHRDRGRGDAPRSTRADGAGAGAA